MLLLNQLSTIPVCSRLNSYYHDDLLLLGMTTVTTIYYSSALAVLTLSTTITKLETTHRPLSSSFLGSPSRILNINHKKELLRGLWVSLLQFLRLY